jgi:hypothetical protein
MSVNVVGRAKPSPIQILSRNDDTRELAQSWPCSYLWRILLCILVRLPICLLHKVAMYCHYPSQGSADAIGGAIAS